MSPGDIYSNQEIIGEVTLPVVTYSTYLVAECAGFGVLHHAAYDARFLFQSALWILVRHLLPYSFIYPSGDKVRKRKDVLRRS